MLRAHHFPLGRIKIKFVKSTRIPRQDNSMKIFYIALYHFTTILFVIVFFYMCWCIYVANFFGILYQPKCLGNYYSLKNSTINAVPYYRVVKLQFVLAKSNPTWKIHIFSNSSDLFHQRSKINSFFLLRTCSWRFTHLSNSLLALIIGYKQSCKGLYKWTPKTIIYFHNMCIMKINFVKIGLKFHK